MSSTSFVILGAAIVSEVIATSALKATDGFTRPGPSVITVIGYAASFYLLSLALKDIPVGVAYATWSGLGIVLIACLGWAVYGQRLDVMAFVGMAMIVAGVAVLNLLSTTGH